MPWSCCRARPANAACRSPTFYTGYRTSVRRDDELIVAVEIPPVEGKQYWRKVGTRRAQAISKVMCAAVRGPAGARSRWAASPQTIVRLPRTEAVLSRGGTLEEAQAALRAEIKPIDDIRSTARLSTGGQRESARSLLGDDTNEVEGVEGIEGVEGGEVRLPMSAR